MSWFVSGGRDGVATLADRRLREHNGRFHLGVLGLVMGRTLGADIPETRSALEESVEIFQRMGAAPLLAQARELLGSATPGVPVTTQSRTSQPVP